MDETDLAGLLRDHATRHSVPGAAIGILRGESTVTGLAGVADVLTREPVTLETRFAVGSLCKPMVATAVAWLADAGRLSLHDRVGDHVPELRAAEWAAHATVRDLLANRARLPLRAELEFSSFPGDDDETLSRFVAQIGTGTPTAPFWSYSNIGWAVLGRVLETVTGRTFEQAMRELVFAPLEMRQSTFLPGAVPCASGHDVGADGVVRSAPWTPRALGPAGATLVSTIPDLLRFANAHLEDSALSELRQQSAEIRIHGWLDAWCLGWARFDWEGGRVWGWDGLISGQRSVLRFVPEWRGAVVLLTNGGTGRALYRSLLPELMSAWFDVRMPALRLEPSADAAGDLSRFEGRYAWPDRRWGVSAERDCLVLAGPDGRSEGLPIDHTTFLVDALDPDTPTVTFAGFDGDGRPGVLYEMLWGLPRL